jgi:hypothetical protein
MTLSVVFVFSVVGLHLLNKVAKVSRIASLADFKLTVSPPSSSSSKSDLASLGALL